MFEAVLNGEFGSVDVKELERAILVSAERCVELEAWYGHWRLEGIGISNKDLAVDAVAELLTRNAAEHYAGFRQVLKRMEPNRSDPASLCECVHGILRKLCRQALSRLLAQFDSTYALSQRALRRHALNTSELMLSDTCLGRVYHLAWSDKLPRRQYMPVDELSARITLPHQQSNAGGGAPRNLAVLVLFSCLDLLEEQDEYSRGIPEEDVLWLTKEILAQKFQEENVESYVLHPFDTKGFEISFRIDDALETTWKYIEDSYVRRGKLTVEEAEAMLKAISDYCNRSAQDEHKKLTAYLHLSTSNRQSRKKLLRIFENIRKHFKDETGK